jgi:hypothetical protein
MSTATTLKPTAITPPTKGGKTMGAHRGGAVESS